MQIDVFCPLVGFTRHQRSAGGVNYILHLKDLDDLKLLKRAVDAALSQAMITGPLIHIRTLVPTSHGLGGWLCPNCGAPDVSTYVQDDRRMYRCNACREAFTSHEVALV